MGNIIGDPFRNEVKKQIEVRQQKLGQFNKDQEILNWENSKTSFLRLASSVNIDGNSEEGKKLMQKYNIGAESELAQKCILYNGITSTSKDKNNNLNFNGLNGGISQPDSPLITNTSYGYGGHSQGFRPMPGLESAAIKFYNRGSLSSAEINIKVFTTEQLELIEMLYMRLGFSILLEWGHTSYIDNKTGNILNQNTFNSKPFNALFDSNNNMYTILEAIKNERLDKSYNYDAFYGKIRNFNWSYLPDNTYNITISAISFGDIIESLNINNNIGINIVNPQSSRGENNTGDNKNLLKVLEVPQIPKEILNGHNKDLKSLNSLEYQLKLIKTQLIKEAGGNTLYTKNTVISYDPKSEREKAERIVRGQFEDSSTFNPTTTKKEKNSNLVEETIPNSISLIDFQNVTKSETSPVVFKKPLPKCYIKLGYLLQIIQNTSLLYFTNNKFPVIKINTDFDNNYCLRLPQTFSLEPNICVVPISWNIAKYRWNYLNKELGDSFITENNELLGKLMHIHVNIDFVIDLFKNRRDTNQGKVELYFFLKNLMSGIEDALGGVNKFSITYDKENNEIIIRDDQNLPYSNKKNNISIFNSTGITQKEGSFLKSVEFNVTMTPNFANMISVGAQANSNVVGEDATALSKLYRGTKDRIMKEKLDIASLENPSPSSLDLEEKIFTVNLDKIDNILKEVYGDLNLSTYKELKALSYSYLQYVRGQLSEEEYLPSSGFIPFDLSLKMEGLAGMRNYERFSVSNEILPSNYKIQTKNGKSTSKVNFLVKGVTHNIQNNIWETTLQSLTIPSDANRPIDRKKLGLVPPPPISDGVPLILKLQALLDTIAWAEGTYTNSVNKGYDIMFGKNNKFEDYLGKWIEFESKGNNAIKYWPYDHPYNIPSVKKRLLENKEKFKFRGDKLSFASGRYQFLVTTWNIYKQQYKKIIDNMGFGKDPTIQPTTGNIVWWEERWGDPSDNQAYLNIIKDKENGTISELNLQTYFTLSDNNGQKQDYGFGITPTIQDIFALVEFSSAADKAGIMYLKEDNLRRAFNNAGTKWASIESTLANYGQPKKTLTQVINKYESFLKNAISNPKDNKLRVDVVDFLSELGEDVNELNKEFDKWLRNK